MSKRNEAPLEEDAGPDIDLREQPGINWPDDNAIASEESSDRYRLLVSEYVQLCRKLPPKTRHLPSPLQAVECLDLGEDLRGIRVLVNFPPQSTNNLYKQWVNYKARTVSRRMDDWVRHYKYTLILDLLQRLPNFELPGYLATDFTVYMPYRRRGDLFNHEKLLTDALMIVIDNDDSRIISGTMRREYDAEQPRIEAHFFQVPPPVWDEKESKRLEKLRKAALPKLIKPKTKKT